MSKDNKKAGVYFSLQKAARGLRQVASGAATTSEALAALAVALKDLEHAQTAAGPTRQEWADEKGPHAVTRRDALPAPLRRKLAKAAAGLEALIIEVKAVPVTRDQVAAAKVARAKAREAKGRVARGAR